METAVAAIIEADMEVIVADIVRATIKIIKMKAVKIQKQLLKKFPSLQNNTLRNSKRTLFLQGSFFIMNVTVQRQDNLDKI